MDRLSIHLQNDETVFSPGQSLQGAIQYRFETEPEYLELSLFWYTSGKGTRDIGVVETRRFEDPGTLGSKDFAFTLPEGPYSFSGRLISLSWLLELTSSSGSRTVRHEIVVSPTGEEIVLESVSTGGSSLGADAIHGSCRIVLGGRR